MGQESLAGETEAQAPPAPHSQTCSSPGVPPSWEPTVSSPQALVPAMLDWTSAVTAGNTPMVTVKMKQTERAGTKIWRKRTQARVFKVAVQQKAQNLPPPHTHRIQGSGQSRVGKGVD